MTYRPLPVRLSRPHPGASITTRKGQAPYVLLGMLAALLVAVPAFADPSIRAKQAEAQGVLEQINALDGTLEQAVEQYNSANVRLDQIRAAQRENAFELRIAKRNLGKSRTAIAQRVVSLYTSEDSHSTLEVILGAKSLDDVVTRMDAADRVASEDRRVLTEVRTSKTAIKRHEQALAEARTAQERLVAERAAQRRSIEGKLSERRQLLSSIQGEIARLQAEERARQARSRPRRGRGSPPSSVRPRRPPPRRRRQLRSSKRPRPLRSRLPRRRRPTRAQRPPRRQPPRRRRATAASSASRCSTSASRTAGAAQTRPASTAPASSRTPTARWASRSRTTRADSGARAWRSRGDLQPGDLVFFDGLGHVGIYIGGDQFIHAPHTGDVVKISSLGESWYASTYVGARRIL